MNMEAGAKGCFRIMYMIGMIAGISSLFFDWYYIQIFSQDGELLGFWGLNLFTGWNTFHTEDHPYKLTYQPDYQSNLGIFLILFLVTAFISSYIVLFHDVKQKDSLEKGKFYGQVIFFMLLVTGFFIVEFPLMELINNRYYFPLVYIQRSDVHIFHCIGPGYLLQLITFILIFPYSLLYYHTVMKFKKEPYSFENVIDNFLRRSQEQLDLDKYIAEEEVKLKFGKIIPEEAYSNAYLEMLKRERR